MYYENKNSYREEKNTIQTGSVEETVVVAEGKVTSYSTLGLGFTDERCVCGDV